MRASGKTKISVSVSSAIVDALDRYAARAQLSRSAAMEHWLARSSRLERRDRLEEETAAYYEAMTEEERRDDAEWVTAVAASVAKLDLDDRDRSRKPAPRRRRRKR